MRILVIFFLLFIHLPSYLLKGENPLDSACQWESLLMDFDFKNALSCTDKDQEIPVELKNAIKYVVFYGLGHKEKASKYLMDFERNAESNSVLKFHQLSIKFLKSKLKEESYEIECENLDLLKHSKFIIHFKKLINTPSEKRKLRFQLASEVHDMAEKYGWINNYYHIRALNHYARMSKNSQITERTLKLAVDLSIQTAINAESNIYHANLLFQLGSHYRRQKNQLKSLKYFNEFFKVKKSHSQYNGVEYLNDDHLAYYVMGQTYNDFNDISNARELYKKSISVLKTVEQPGSELYIQRLTFYQNGLSILLKKEGNLSKAFETLIPHYRNLMESPHSSFIWLPEIQYNLATILIEMGRIEESEELLIDALSNLDATYLQDFKNANDYSQVYSTLKTMSFLLASNWDINKRITHNQFMLKLAHHLCFIYRDFILQDRILSYYKNWFKHEIGYFSEHFEELDQKQKNHLIELVNAQKTIAFKRSYVHDYSEDVSSLIKKQEDLKLKLKSFDDNSDEYNDVVDSLRIVNRRLNFLREPKPDSDTSKLIQVELEMMKTSEAFINFFTHEGSYYRLSHYADHTSLKMISECQSLDQLIYNFREDIYTGFLVCGESRLTEIEELQKTGNQLYLMLFEGIDFSSIERLYISPDQVISLLPFDALYESSSERYFVEMISWSFQNDFDFIHNEHVDEIRSIELFAPIFKDQLEEFCEVDEYRVEFMGDLKYNKIEAQKISEMFGSASFNSKLEEFIQVIEDGEIIHLATHSKVDIQENDNSFIAFKNEKNEIEKLSIRDLQFLKSNAECVVLSSCESGVGDYEYGKGLTSLAKAFLASGIKSVVSSLWSVNDRSNSIIMENFYRNLAIGKSKDEALASAKISYLKSIDKEYKHPFYWSGLVMEGEINPIRIINQTNGFGRNHLYLIIGIMSLFVILFIKYKM